jgi:hypothetical protein
MTNGYWVASKSLIKFGGRKTEVNWKANEKTRRKTPNPESTRSVDPDQRIHKWPEIRRAKMQCCGSGLGMFIPDPDFLSTQDPEVKKAPNPGSATEELRVLFRGLNASAGAQ